MADDAQPAAPIVPTLPTAYRTYDEATRRRLMYLLVGGFYLYSWLLAYFLVGQKGYELSSAAQAIIVMTLTAMISGVSLATGYYYGTTIGSAQKGMMIQQLQANQKTP
jgi:hypothetical protein